MCNYLRCIQQSFFFIVIFLLFLCLFLFFFIFSQLQVLFRSEFFSSNSLPLSCFFFFLLPLLLYLSHTLSIYLCNSLSGAGVTSAAWKGLVTVIDFISSQILASLNKTKQEKKKNTKMHSALGVIHSVFYFLQT